MPRDSVLHIGNAFAFGGVREEATGVAGSPRRGGQEFAQLFVIVAVALAHFPTERAPFVGERFEGQRFGDGREALDFVVVDDGDKIVEAMVRRKKNRLPIGTFIAFAIAHQNENAMSGAGAFAREGHARADGEPVAERAGAEFDAGNSFVRNMAAEIAAVLAMIEQAFEGEKSAFGERGVNG